MPDHILTEEPLQFGEGGRLFQCRVASGGDGEDPPCREHAQGARYGWRVECFFFGPRRCGDHY